MRARLAKGATAEEVRERTGVSLGAEYRSLNTFNLGAVIVAALEGDEGVEIEGERIEMSPKKPPKKLPEKKGVADAKD